MTKTSNWWETFHRRWMKLWLSAEYFRVNSEVERCLNNDPLQGSFNVQHPWSILSFLISPQLRGDSLRLCGVSQAELRPGGMWHGVLLPLSAAVAPQPDVWPGPTAASPPHVRRHRCLHAVRLQWRTRRRWHLLLSCFSAPEFPFFFFFFKFLRLFYSSVLNKYCRRCGHP